MKVCPNCGQSLPDDSIYCGHCGKSQVSKAERKPSFPVLGIIIIIGILIIGILLVPKVFPEIAAEKPGNILLTGVITIVIGLVAWYIEWSGKARLVGRASCCLFFPIIGLFIFIFGIYTLFAGSPSANEVCTIKLKGYSTYISLRGNGAESLCREALTESPSLFVKSDNSPDKPVVCKDEFDDIEFMVVDTSNDGTGGNIACKSFYESVQD